MARDIYINGEVLVRARGGAVGAAVANLGLCSDSVVVTPKFNHLDIQVDAWGGKNGPPMDVQWMLAEAQITMTLVHLDAAVLDACLRSSMGGAATAGRMVRAGTRLRGNNTIASTANNLIELYLTAPIAGGGALPWYFPTVYMTGPPVQWPIGVERSLVQATFRAIPVPVIISGVADPYGAGAGAGTAVAPTVEVWRRAAVTGLEPE